MASKNDEKTLVSLSKQPHGLAYEDMVIEVCRLFCQGLSFTDIAKAMEKQHGLAMTREMPYKYLQHAASSGLLRVVTPREEYLSKKINQKFRWLSETIVVHTTRVEDVAQSAAEMLVRLLQESNRQEKSKDTVHVGFPGGYVMWKVLEKFSELLLKEPIESLPNEVVFHHLVSALDSESPKLHAGSFFLDFQSEKGEQIHIQFKGCTAPSVIESELKGRILDQPFIKQAYEEIKDGEILDIILTSASDFEDKHSIFRRDYFETDKLLEDGCVGDMLWSPLNSKGPIEQKNYNYSTLALVDLKDFPSYIQKGKHVLLVIGPCGGCGEPKTRILDTILNLSDQFITHLVVDSQTARGLFQEKSISQKT